MSKNVYSMQAQSYMLQVTHSMKVRNSSTDRMKCLKSTTALSWPLLSGSNLSSGGENGTPPSLLMEEQDADRRAKGPAVSPLAERSGLTDPPDGRMSLVVTNVHEHIEIFELQPVNVWYTYVLMTVWLPLGIRKLLQNAYQITCNNFSVWKAPHKPSQ